MILALFFTRGVSLEIWVNQGLFDREKLLYEEHLNQGNLSKVYWLTYGFRDKKLSEQLKKENRLHKDIEIFAMPRIFNIFKIGSYLYSLFLPIYYKNVIKQSSILKTNQMDGSWSGVFSKWINAKPLIVRSGYTMSQLEYSKNKNSLRYKYYVLIEKFAYKFCDIAIVSSKHNKKYLLENKYINKNNIQIITNFIGVDTFKHTNKRKYENKMLFVGRLNEEKNIFNLISAISKTNLTLDIYGNGNIEERLKKFAKEIKANVNFMGIVANEQLPSIYNRYQYYILPSYFEGMPKTLLEAMACGCVCIGTNVSGINEVIKDNINGYLASNVDCDSLQDTINKAINLENNKIILNAIKDIQDNYSLKSITEKEKNVIDVIT